MKKILLLIFVLISLASFGQVPDTSRAKKVYGNMIWVKYDTTAATWDTLGIFPGSGMWATNTMILNSESDTALSVNGTSVFGDAYVNLNSSYWIVKDAATDEQLTWGAHLQRGINVSSPTKMYEISPGYFKEQTISNNSVTAYGDTIELTRNGAFSRLSYDRLNMNGLSGFNIYDGSGTDLVMSIGTDSNIVMRGNLQVSGELSGNTLYTGDAEIDGDLIVNGTFSYAQTSIKTPPVYKTTSGTLAKTDRFVLASGDITLTAPAITSADSGLTITVKNIGAPEDLVTFIISGTTADGIDTARLTRWVTRTIVAGNDGKWYTYEKNNRTDYVYDISYSGSFQTIQECISFLDEHMAGPSVIRLGGGDYEIDSTITIDLPYPLTLRGFSYQTTNLIPVTGLNGLPMFRCISDVSIENFQVDATDLASYGDSDGEDFIRFAGSGTYNEIKNFYIKGFWNAIVDSTDAELWIQEGDIDVCNSSGIKLTGADDSVVVRVVTTDFIGCDKGIWMLKGSKAYIDIDGGCGFRNDAATDSAIVYVPATFANYINMYISGTTFNNVGTYLSGFDFTRSDGRDANIFVDNNAGVESKNPHAYINVLNNASTTTCTAADTMYKAVFTNTSSYTCKFTIAANKMTYQPTNRRDVVMTISGNMSVNANSRNLNVCVLKNGIKTTKYGEMTVRATTSGQAYPFATTVYMQSVTAGDYFEIFVSSPNAGDLITVQDVTWMSQSF